MSWPFDAIHDMRNGARRIQATPRADAARPVLPWTKAARGRPSRSDREACASAVVRVDAWRLGGREELEALHVIQRQLLREQDVRSPGGQGEERHRSPASTSTRSPAWAADRVYHDARRLTGHAARASASHRVRKPGRQRLRAARVRRAARRDGASALDVRGRRADREDTRPDAARRRARSSGGSTPST